MFTMDDAREVAPMIETLGDLANLFRVMDENGWTEGSVEYVVKKVFWQ